MLSTYGQSLRRVFCVLGLCLAAAPWAQELEAEELRAFQVGKRMEKDINEGLAHPDIGVRLIGNRYFLQGIVDRVDERVYALEVCKSFVEADRCVSSIRIRAVPRGS